MGDDSWQENAFSHRHMHNRVTRSDRSSGKGQSFDVKRTFGDYELDCKSYKKLRSSDEAPTTRTGPSLAIYGFVPGGLGLSGRLHLPSVMEATVVFAASRKNLQRIVDALTVEPEGKSTVDDGDIEAAISHPSEDGGGATTVEDGSPAIEQEDVETPDAELEESDESETEEDRTRRRIEAFEKNSFRSPKFWFRWQGSVHNPRSKASTAPTERSAEETNSGYIVFSGNDCRNFSATLTCDVLGWKNAAITGRRVKARDQRDVEIVLV